MSDRQDQLREIAGAIIANQALDYSADVLGSGCSGKLERKRRPPVMIACFEEYAPRGNAESGLKNFETLSLAARANLLDFEKEDCAPSWASNWDKMQRFRGEDIAEAIYLAAQALGPDHHRSRLGLQLVGAQIDGNIDLTNMDIPFSVRLIGCAIHGYVRVSRATLPTLDLSGSAFKGLYGTFLRANGSVRLRRVLSSGAIDFGGLQVIDVFDACDALVLPLELQPEADAFAGERGAFNLSLAAVGNELRLKRARIYGGLTMKSCRVERSIFLDDAILRAPIAYLEHVGFNYFRKAEIDVECLPLTVRTAARAEVKLAKEIHGDPHEPGIEGEEVCERNWRVKFETIEPFELAKTSSAMLRDQGKGLLSRFLAESNSARVSCFRFDGLHVKGSVFARSIKASGRIHGKYAKVDGGVHLDGARLRSPRDVEDGLEEIGAKLKPEGAVRGRALIRFANRLKKVLDDTLEHAKKLEWVEGRDDCALDLRNAHIGGDLSLKLDNRVGKTGEFDHELRDVLWGQIAHLDKSNRKLLKAWRDDPDGPDRHVHTAYVNGWLSLNDAKIEGDLTLKGVLANLHRVEPIPNGREKEAFLKMEQCTIGGEADFRDSVGIRGIEAQYVKIGARIRFMEHSVRAKKLERQALLVGGKFQFTDAEIGGDAQFLFDPDSGPHLLLARSRIGGRLHILPALHGICDRAHGEGAGTRRRMLRHWRSPTPLDPNETASEIDLRSASAAEFGHHELAWPKRNRLQAAGFVYQQTTDYGPLAPRGVSVGDEPQSPNRDLWGNARLLGGVILAWAAVVAGVGLSGGFTWLSREFGAPNVAVLVVCLVVAVSQLVVRQFSKHRSASGVSPRARAWLELQKASSSVYQVRGETIPLQPYTQASRVLRSGGMVLAANEIESERLRRRCEQLSWRNDWPIKIPLQVAGLVTGFGFKPFLTILIATSICAIAGGLFHIGDQHSYVRPSNGDLLQAVGGEAAVFSGGVQSTQCQTRASHTDSLYPAFSSLQFAADVMVPGLDLGQESHWRLAPPRSERAWSLLAYLEPLLKIIGWMLTTAIAISILTRIEGIVARNEE